MATNEPVPGGWVCVGDGVGDGECWGGLGWCVGCGCPSGDGEADVGDGLGAAEVGVGSGLAPEPGPERLVEGEGLAVGRGDEPERWRRRAGDAEGDVGPAPAPSVVGAAPIPQAARTQPPPTVPSTVKKARRSGGTPGDGESGGRWSSAMSPRSAGGGATLIAQPASCDPGQEPLAAAGYLAPFDDERPSAASGSNQTVRAMAAARPLPAITSAILRDASSIISEPSITAPRAPPAADV